MGLFDRFSRKRDAEERGMTSYNNTNLSGTIFSMFTTNSEITEEDAMKIPAVVACIELISGSIAQLPVYLYKQNAEGEVERVGDDKRLFLLNNEPNDLLNGYNLKRKIVKDYLFYGVSYVKKEMARNDVVQLNPFIMDNVHVKRYLIDGYKWDADIQLTWVGANRKTMEKNFKPRDLIVVVKDSEDGVTGTGVLQSGTETLRLALNEVEYSSSILKNGALPIGVIETVNKLSETAIKRLRTGWETLYGGAKNSGKTVILEEGLQYKPISIKPNDLQLVDSKRITISDIARLFNVPESMLNADANKYASNEQNNLHFLQYTLAPVLNAIESALDKSLLLESEKQDGYYFRFDTSEILRTTEKEKIENAATGLQKGLYSLNETRAKLDLHKLKDDYFIWSLGNVLYNPETNEIIVPNMQGTGDLDNPAASMTQSVDNVKQTPQKVSKGGKK
ncbi:MAG TPA: phage portal protein [Pseudoneobacillus sp.]|nr:phage portal protein [Pseudoneobacillus sp.]